MLYLYIKLTVFYSLHYSELSQSVAHHSRFLELSMGATWPVHCCLELSSRSFLPITITTVTKHERPRQSSPCRGLSARRASNLQCDIQNVKTSLSLPSIIVHADDGRKKRRTKTNSISPGRKRKPSSSFITHVCSWTTCANKVYTFTSF